MDESEASQWLLVIPLGSSRAGATHDHLGVLRGPWVEIGSKPTILTTYRVYQPVFHDE